MMNEQKFYILGSGWISALGNGAFESAPRFSSSDTDFKLPDLQEYIGDLPSRFGRFDMYSKVCFSTAVLALNDAGMLQREEKKNIGIVVGSSSGVYDNDISYYNSTKEESGAFTSPNLFSYTLPNVALGEIAVFFNFVGPSFCVGNNPESPGMDVIPAALSMLESKQCDRILVGWVEVSRNIRTSKDLPKGAAFALLTLDEGSGIKAEATFGSQFKFSELFKG